MIDFHDNLGNEMSAIAQEENYSILRNWISKNIELLKNSDRVIRRNFLKEMQRRVNDNCNVLSEKDYCDLFSISCKDLLMCLKDPVEKCREIAADILRGILQKQKFINEDTLQCLMGMLLVSLGVSDERECSEEVRLIEIDIIKNIVELASPNLLKHMSDIVHILSKCIIDPFPEVKYRSCDCAANAAYVFRKNFHMCSATLINPLLETLSHQHSKTRISCVTALGAVIRYGDNQNVKDVVSHLAQRLFDSSPSVRLAVVQVIGIWLVKLPDRYSFFPNLIPLLLSSLSDEVPEVRNTAKNLWEEAGRLFLEENENDYKDLIDFPKPTPVDYPGERPSLGCRVLVQKYMYNILPALLNDVDDWVPETRIKSAELLCNLVRHCEDKATMKLESFFEGIVFSAKDEEEKTREMALKSSELIGYFTDEQLWWNHISPLILEKPVSCHFEILASVIRGHGKTPLETTFSDICIALANPVVCRVRKPEDQANLLLCVEALLLANANIKEETSYSLFSVLVSIAGLTTNQDICKLAQDHLQLLCSKLSLNSALDLYNRHALQILKELTDNYLLWTSLNPEVPIFIYMVENGCVIDDLASFAVPIIVTNLHTDHEPKLRSHLLSLVTTMLKTVNMDENGKFTKHIFSLIHDGLFPNMVWSAGKTAAALRAIAIANLWELIRTQRCSDTLISSIGEEFLPLLNSLADDDLATTRLLACRITEKVLPVLVSFVVEQKIHKTAQEFLRCLDDELDDARIAAIKVFKAYFTAFPSNYNWSVYKSYLKHIYKNVMIHMDDQNKNVQMAVFELLKEVSFALPEILMEELMAVKPLMSATDLCDELSQHVEAKLTL